MPATITFFPVGNGDMTLLKLNDGSDQAKQTTILVDCCISENSDSEFDASLELRDRLPRDNNKRPYIDAFCLSHPDEDHCRGLRENFHLGPLDDYDDDVEDDEKKIIIREMWSSPLVFRRASKKNTLCKDAKAWRSEARRRVDKYRREKNKGNIKMGDRILLIGKDIDKNGNDKNADIAEIVQDVDTDFSRVCGGDKANYLSVSVVGPLAKGDIDEDEELLASNRSSIILRYFVKPKRGSERHTIFLTGGDAEVAVWEKLWKRHKAKKSRLQYDVLQAPHHCSWHVLSHGSWSDGEREVSKDARAALSQIREGGSIVASSKAIKEHDSDPPCVGARDEYEDIAKGASGEFYCTGQYLSEDNLEALEFVISSGGHQPKGGSGRLKKATGASAAYSQPAEHGRIDV